MIRWGYNIQAETESTPPHALARTWYTRATIYRQKLSPSHLVCSLEHDTLGLQPTAEIRSAFCNTLGLIGFGAKEAWSWSVLRRINGELKSLPISYRRKLCLSLQKSAATLAMMSHDTIATLTVTSQWHHCGILSVCSHWTQLVCRGLVLYVPRLLLFHTLVGNETTVVAKIIIFVASFWLVDLV